METPRRKCADCGENKPDTIENWNGRSPRCRMCSGKRVAATKTKTFDRLLEKWKAEGLKCHGPCKKVKPFRLFSSRGFKPNGQQRRPLYCLKCANLVQKMRRARGADRPWIEKNRERIREKDRRLKRRERALGKRTRTSSPTTQREKLRQWIADMIQRGTITKPKTCDRCTNSADNYRLSGVMPESGRSPKDVIFLCYPCLWSTTYKRARPAEVAQDDKPVMPAELLEPLLVTREEWELIHTKHLVHLAAEDDALDGVRRRHGARAEFLARVGHFGNDPCAPWTMENVLGHWVPRMSKS